LCHDPRAPFARHAAPYHSWEQLLLSSLAVHFQRRSFRIGLAAAIVGAYLVLAIASAALKAPWWDEAWFASPAWNLAAHGRMGTDVLVPGGWRQGIEQRTYWVMPLYLVTLAGWFKIFGFGLLRMRLLSVLAGLLALVSWYVVMLRVTGDRRVAFLAFALIAVGHASITLASEGRMDMMAAALSVAALAAYLTLRERNLAGATLAGHSLAAAAMLTHPNGVLGLAGLLLLAAAYDRSRLTLRLAAIAIAPYVVASLAWAGYIMQDPHNFKRQFFGNVEERGTGFDNLYVAIRGEAWRYFGFYAFGPHWAETRFNMLLRPWHDWPLFVPGVYIAAVIACASVRELRGRPGIAALLALAALGAIWLTVIDTHKRYYYLVYVMPAYTALAAVVAVWAWDHVTHARRLIAAVLTALLATNVALDLRQMGSTPQWTGYEDVVRYIRAHSPGTLRVIGGAELAFELGFGHGLVDDNTLGYWSRSRPDWIVIGLRYKGHMLDPAEPAAIRKYREHRLSEYRPVLDTRFYRLYARTGASADS